MIADVEFVFDDGIAMRYAVAYVDGDPPAPLTKLIQRQLASVRGDSYHAPGDLIWFEKFGG